MEMKFSTWIFLWLIPLSQTFLAAHGNLPPGTVHPPLETQGGHPRIPGLLRSRRQTQLQVTSRTGTCTADDLKKNPNKCCLMCPAGYHKKSSSPDGCAGGQFQCSLCGEDVFTAIENKKQECLRCKVCQDTEEEVSPCRPDNNTVCICKKGHYRNGEECEKCTDCCPGIFSRNGDEQRRCETCGKADCSKERIEACQHFCLTTTPTTTTASTASTTTAGRGDVDLFLPAIISLMVILFLGCLLTVTLCVCARRGWFLLPWTLEKTAKQNLPRDSPRGKSHPADLPCEDPKPSVIESPARCLIDGTPQVSKNYAQIPQLVASQHASARMLVTTPSTCFPSPYSVAMPLLKAEPKIFREDSQVESWPAAVLYAIIKEVPVRRWKEFLRLLSVPDGQMERVEMEAGPCYLEQQYQMLRLWSQRGGVGMENVYSALHSMNLSGCAQELQDKLEQLQQAAKNTRGEAP